MNLVRPNIAQMTGYVPGEQPRGAKVVKLNTNEHPYAPSAKTVQAIAEAAQSSLRRYPDALASRVPYPGGRALGRRPRMGPLRQRQRRLADDRHPGVRWRGGRRSVSQPELRAVPHAGGHPGRGVRHRALRARLVARVPLHAARAWAAAGVPGEPQQPFGHAAGAGRGGGDRRRPALPPAGGRGVRRLRRHALRRPRPLQRAGAGEPLAVEGLRAGRAAVRLPRRPAAGDRRTPQGEGQLQLRRAGRSPARRPPSPTRTG